MSHDLCITGVFQMEAERQQKTQENFGLQSLDHVIMDGRMRLRHIL